MTNLQRTIIVPGGNPETILSQKILKMIVIVDNDSFVEKADNLALDKPAGIERYVVWYLSPDFDQLKKAYPDLPDNLSGVVAFSLSTKNKVADTIKSNEQLSYSRIDSSFTKAGLPEFN